jgi:hypothetical protein
MRVAHTGLSLNLSGLLWSANRRVEALDMMAVALDAARTLGDRALHGHAALRNANALADEGRADEAWPLYDEAYTAMREVSKTGGENVELCRGISLFAVGDLPRAQAVLERVKANSLRMGDPPNGWRADLVLASVALVDASYGEAERLADQALGAMGDHSGQQAEALALRGIARMLRGRKDDGMDDLGSAHAAIGSDRGRGWWCWRVFDGLARGMDLTRMGQVLKQTQPDRWVRALHAWALGLDGDLLRD